MDDKTLKDELTTLCRNVDEIQKKGLVSFERLYKEENASSLHHLKRRRSEIENKKRDLAVASSKFLEDKRMFDLEKSRNEDSFLKEKCIIKIRADRGKVFMIAKVCLCLIKGSHLERMFSGRFSEMILQENEYYHLDVNITTLRTVSRFLREIDLSKGEKTIYEFLRNIPDEEGRIRHEFLLLGLIDNRPNFENLKMTKNKKTHSRPVDCLTVINNFIVSGSDNKTINFRDISTLDCIRTIERAHSDWILSLTSWNDSIVSCSLDRTIKIWNLSNGSCIRTLTGHSSCIYCVILFNDQIVSGSGDNTIKIWNPNNGNCLQTLIGHAATVHCLCILNNDTIVSGSSDGSIKIWNVSSRTCISTLTGHSSFVWSLIVLNDLIISGSADKTIKIWDPLNGNCISTLTDHSDWVVGLCVVDEQHFISCSLDNTLKIWNISSNECVRTLNSSNGVQCVTFHENQIICGLYNGSIEVWEEIKS